MVRLGELIVILDLHRQGLTVSAIARRTGLDRKTVRKYIARGLEPPVYGPRLPRPRLIEPFEPYLRERIVRLPELSGARLLREIRGLGYAGGRTALTDYLREIRPIHAPLFERRFETAPGEQAQADFAHFKVAFTDQPDELRVVWLFAMVLGHSRYLFARFCLHQDLHSLIRLHVQAFEHFAGVPKHILYDRMKTAVIGEDAEGQVIYNGSLVQLARHYGFQPRACKPYRAKTKGKIERPFRYIRQDFFLGRTFQNLEDLNAQLDSWLDEIANARLHGTTCKVVREAFEAERAALQTLPELPFRAVLELERRVTHEGLVAVGGNFYSVPDCTRSRVVEVHTLADELHIFEANRLIAVHPILAGRRQTRIAEGHRQAPAPKHSKSPRTGALGVGARTGEEVARRPLSFYEAVGRRLARTGAGR